MKKYISYSEIHLYLTDPALYYATYVIGIKQKPNKSMILGKIIHEVLANNEYRQSNRWKRDIIEKLFQPEYITITQKIIDKLDFTNIIGTEIKIFADWEVPLFGIIDAEDIKGNIIDYKTTSNQGWDKDRVDRDLQLSFYAWIYYLTKGRLPGLKIIELNTNNGKIKEIQTKRSIEDIKEIEILTRGIIKELKERGWWELRKSKEEMINS